MSDNLPVPQQENDLELLKQQDVHQYDIAKMSIEANLKNQHEVRDLMWATTKANVLVILAIVATAFIFFMYALHLGKDAFLSDILKVLVGAFGGGGIGYAIGIQKNK